MAQFGPIPKDDGSKHARPVKGADAALVPADGGRAFDVPPPKKTWLKSTKDAWLTFWDSEVGDAVQAIDVPAVTRLHHFYDEWERALKDYRDAGRTTEGSQGQQVLHPMGTQLTKLETSISKLEERLGITPASRARLGIARGQEQLTVAALLKALDGGYGDGTAEVIDVQPLDEDDAEVTAFLEAWE